MKRILLGLAAAMGFAGTAHAADPAAGLYGNTLTIEGPAGVRKIWLNEDKTLSGVDEKGGAFAGIWEIDGGKICTTVKTPVARPKHCPSVANRKVGDKWEDMTPSGDKVQASVVAGR